MAEVQSRMLAVPGVTAVHDLHVWAVTSGMVAMSGHAIVPNLDDHPTVLEGIRAEMARLGIGHVTIQLEVQHECEEPRRWRAPGIRMQAPALEAGVGGGAGNGTVIPSAARDRITSVTNRRP